MFSEHKAEIALVLLTVVALLAVAYFEFFKKTDNVDIKKVAKSVCANSGYDNWAKLEKQRDGSYTVLCYNKEWRVVIFEI